MDLSSLLHTDELLETIVHLLDGLVLGETHTTFVGDVVDATLGLGVLATGSAHLEVELSGGLFELDAVGGELGQLDVDGSADGRSQVGGAEGQESETVVVREGDAFLDLVDGVGQTLVDGLQVTTLLHGDDAQVIFFVAPHQEGLVHVVVDTTASGPVTASVGSLEETISFLEEEVIIDELLLDLLGHASQRVESSLELTLESGESGRDFVFHLFVLGLSETGVEGVSLHRASATDTGGDDELTFGVQVAQSLDITEVAAGVFVSGLESSVVVADDGVEKVSEDRVRLGIGSVHTDSGVQILHTRLDNIEEGGSEGGLQVLCFVQDLAGQEFLQQGLAAVICLHLGESSLEFFLNCSINHLEIVCGPANHTSNIQ